MGRYYKRRKLSRGRFAVRRRKYGRRRSYRSIKKLVKRTVYQVAEPKYVYYNATGQSDAKNAGFGFVIGTINEGVDDHSRLGNQVQVRRISFSNVIYLTTGNVSGVTYEYGAIRVRYVLGYFKTAPADLNAINFNDIFDQSSGTNVVDRFINTRLFKPLVDKTRRMTQIAANSSAYNYATGVERFDLPTNWDWKKAVKWRKKWDMRLNSDPTNPQSWDRYLFWMVMSDWNSALTYYINYSFVAKISYIDP